uniref:Uncharacterized protein n=1 Tax=Tanacetum cinerariifolium TaxID=118510 RepID=A0A699RYB1_TANCI|nr:hypothetical protein [Tanacetum cinerariifolium]
MLSTRAVSYAALRAQNPAISTTCSVLGDARGGGKLPRAPHPHPPLSSSVEPLLALWPLLLVLAQDLTGSFLQAPPQDLPEGLL